MNRRTILGLLLAGLALAGGTPTEPGDPAPGDRLERFRQLAASRLGALELSGHAPSEEALAEIYALLDDEIVESLASGSLFASEAFLQEQLDAFTDTWGGAALRIRAVGDRLVVGAFQLSPGGPGNSVRVYDRRGGARLVQAIHGEGAPLLEELPPRRTGAPQFLVAWVGPQSSRGNTALRLELWQAAGASVSRAWSTDSVTEDRLWVSQFSVGGQEVSFRYEVRYPGWKPGCDGQTEHEDLYRYVPARETFVLARRQVHHGWHRDFHAGLLKFLRALETRDARLLAELAPERAVRARLPARLAPDLACDEADAPSPATVATAAVSADDGQPWTLVFRRTAKGWRLAAADPVEPFSATITR